VKQLVFMVVTTLAGTVGVYLISPFYGVFVYSMFAVLRPQYMWEWSLPEGVAWSYYVAIATIGAGILGVLGAIDVRDSQAAKEQQPHRLGIAHWSVLLFGLWIGVTYMTARNTDAAYPWFEVYLKIFLMYLVSAYLIRSVRQVWILYVMTALVLGYIAYEINYLYLVNGYLGIFHNGYGGLDNNGAGLMLAMGAPLCWFCYEGFQRWWRWAFLLVIPVIIHAVLMTYSRGAMMSLLVMCPFLVLRSRRRLQLGAAFLAFAVVLIPIMAGPQISDRFLTIRDHDVDESANNRRQSWWAAWQIANDNPLFGVGVRNANLFSHQYGADREGRTIHSQYLQIAADNGLVGLALYLGALGTAWLSLRRCRRAVADRMDDESCRIAAIANGVECSMAVYCCGAIFLSLEVFELPYLLLLLAAQLEVVSQPGQTHAEPPLLNTHQDTEVQQLVEMSSAAP
jgi:probable O-glycosylation ligase (exosortase A-associated)